MNRKLRQLSQGERLSFVDFSANGKPPISGVELDRLVHVIANKKVRYRRQPAVEIINRRFKIEESQRAHDHPVFTGKVDRASWTDHLRPALPSHQSCRSDRRTRQALEEIPSFVHECCS